MNRIVSSIFVLVAMICGACTGGNEQEKKLVAEMRLFKSEAITLPNNLIAKHVDDQTLPESSLLKRPLKLVIYISQEGCGDCKLRALIPIYMFILENNHLNHFGVIIILNPADEESAFISLKYMRFRHTVFFDLDGSFERLNPHLPKNGQFHTFLLNKDNKVVLIGNPLQNEQMKKLYLTEMNR